MGNNIVDTPVAEAQTSKTASFATAFLALQRDLCGTPRSGEIRAVLTVVLDDTGNCRSTDYVAISGYIAHADLWSVFMRDWLGVLQAKGLTSLHTADYLRAQYGGKALTDEQSELVDLTAIEPFIRAIKDSRLYGISAVVDCAAYAQLSQDDQRLLGKPDELAFDMAVAWMAGYSTLEHEKETLSIVFDESDNSAMRIYGLYRGLKKRNPALRGWLGSICFANDAISPPLQASDLLGNFVNKAMRRRRENLPWPVAYSALTGWNDARTKRRFVGTVFKAEHLAELCARRRADPFYLPQASA